MRVFLLDLWLDLREKRLAPVAVLLAAGIIAVPVVLAKGTSAPPAAPATTATVASAAPVIQSQPAAGPVESKLQTFSPRDPFEPTAVASTGSTGSSSTGTSAGGTSSGGASSGTGTSGGATTGSGPTSGTGTGTGTTTGTTGTGNTTGETKTTLFTYTVDLRFGESGDVKAFKDVKRLDLIPSEDNPKIVFLGVTTTGKTAVFLIDSNIGVDTAGGKCRPTADECTFLYLRPDDDHNEAILTDSDGTVYHMRLLAIHRVSVSSSNGTSNSGSGKKGSSRSNAFTGSAGSTGSADSSSTTPTTSDDTTVPGGDTPPGEPEQRSQFRQFFADSGQ